jgi:large subunit ribosomal protein L29
MKHKEKLKELNSLSDEQFNERLKDLGVSLLKNRFELKTGHVDNPGIIREIRKDIARIKTIATIRSMAGKERKGPKLTRKLRKAATAKKIAATKIKET